MPEYRLVDVADLPDAPGPSTHKKEVDEAVKSAELSFNVFTAHPGEKIAAGYHYHPRHEELLYVIEGELQVETADGDYTIEPGQALYIPPGAPQVSRSIGEGPARVIAIGAPKSASEGIIVERCPVCEEETECDYERTSEVQAVSCGNCGTEIYRYVPGPDE
ncbi:MAG: cupin domain-containing protein [Salinigranum sp.]